MVLLTPAEYQGLQGPLHVPWHDRAGERRAVVRRKATRWGDDLRRGG
jgi:hypothetical protein